MSALAAIFMGNSVVFATDTICSDPTVKITKNGQEVETIAGFSSKSIYLPHLQTSVAVMGLTLLSLEYHEFIDKDYSNRAIRSFDELLSSTEKNFIKFIDRREIRDFKKPDELEDNGFLGCVFLIGLSQVDDKGEKREVPVMQCFKLQVYKTRIIKTLMNTHTDEFMYTMHPPLPKGTVSSILDKHLKSPNAVEDIIIDLIKESKSIYESSFRKELLTGGDINFTSMSYVNKRLNVSHYTGYTFDDIDDVINEIKSYSKIKKDEAMMEVISENLEKVDFLERVVEVKSQVENLEVKYPELNGIWADFKALLNNAIKCF